MRHIRTQKTYTTYSYYDSLTRNKRVPFVFIHFVIMPIDI